MAMESFAVAVLPIRNQNCVIQVMTKFTKPVTLNRPHRNPTLGNTKFNYGIAEKFISAKITQMLRDLPCSESFGSVSDTTYPEHTSRCFVVRVPKLQNRR